MAKLAYMFPTFPVFHQTFVLWEVLGLQRNGVRPRIYSLQRAAGRQQPEAQSIAREVTYLPGVLAPVVWGANGRLLRRGVRRYLGLYRDVWQAWRTGPNAADVAAHAGRRLRWRARLRAWFNGSPTLYLLKSWLLVPVAAYVAERFEAEGITHVHVHWASYPATVAYVVHRICGIPFSISAHAYDIYMVPRLLPAKVRAARFVVTCARSNAEFLTRITGPGAESKVIVSYHGVDVTRFTPAVRASDDAPLRLMSCGQLERYKGMHVLVDACAELDRRGIAVECAIVGEGRQRPQLEAQIAAHALAGRVHLRGALPHVAVADLLRTSDVFVLASEIGGKYGRRDVIANVIVEAMAAGVAVVASHIPGLEELVEHGVSGLLVAPNDPTAVADAVARLARSPEERRRLGQAARRRVLRDFDNSKNVRMLTTLLAQQSQEGEPRLAVG